MGTRSKQHVCLLCDKNCAIESELEDHLRNHVQEKPYECDVCKKSFSTNRLFQRHLRSHEIRGNFSCSVCKVTFPYMVQLDRHMKGHTRPKDYKCSVCDRVFKLKGNLKRHEIQHTKQPRITRYERYACMFCSKCFVDENLIFGHLRSHIKEFPFECKICDFSTNSEKFLRNHQARHISTGYNCRFCDKVFKSYSTRWVHEKHAHIRKELHKCSICKYSSYVKYEFKRHLRVHTGERFQQCEVCQKSFTSGTALKLHRAVHFPELRKEQSRDCTICGMTLRSFLSLKAHFKRKHSEVRPHSCQFCSKNFKTRSELGSHLTTHTTEKLYKCSVCVKTFTCSASRRSHEQTVHIIDNPEIQCEICRQTMRKTQYKQHMIRHRKIRCHACLFCGKGFVTAGELFAHIRIHIQEKNLEEKKFVCIFCGKSARNTISHLYSHISTHINERPFFCPKCGQEEKWKQVFKNHVKNCFR